MLMQFLSLVVFVALMTGCGLHAQTYVMTKPRVGIEKGSGNAGYLAGTPQYKEPERKTRKVYILEITKAIPENEVKKVEQEIAGAPHVDVKMHEPVVSPTPVADQRRIEIPSIEDTDSEPVAPAVATGPSEDITYTVLKDDTLQKIAKKYYGSYGAWLKIYNANKEKIKNPNLVRPGTVIVIPAEKINQE